MKNYVQEGERITVAAPSALASGEGVVIEDLFGVAECAAAQGEEVTLVLEGVFILPKAAGALPLGKKVYWDAAAKNVTATANANKEIGKVFVAAADASASVQVRII